MLKRVTQARFGRDRGDTLIEVTVALSILAAVLLSSTAVVTLAFRTGQTARERTAVAEEAQQQMEALRSFRDNSQDWTTFQAGIDPVAGGFHMVLQTNGTTTQWVPVAGPLMASNLAASGMNPSNWVPTATMTFSTTTPVGPVRDCGYDFKLSYSFQTIGGDVGVPAQNEISTRLVNLRYVPPAGGPQCP